MTHPAATDVAKSSTHQPQPDDSISPPAIGPGSVIGMLGGGQLGRMFAIAATSLGYRVIVLTDQPDCPAATVAHETIVGNLKDHATLDRFADACDVVTLEFENIPVDALDYLSNKVGVFPSAGVLRVAQDRGIEKQTLRVAGLPVTAFRLVNSLADAEAALDALGQPIVLKTTRDGYDGKGQWKIESLECLQACASRGGEENGLRFDRPLIAEAWVPYEKEVSVIIARSRRGDQYDVAVYPAFENRHRNHILDVTLCPAGITSDTEAQAKQMAIRAAEAIDLVGLICIEFFVLPGGDLLINEIAPRPHNSGHLTIDACHTSQFEQQVRSVCGLPLGDPGLIVPASVMVNVMGEMWHRGEPDWPSLLEISGAHLHLYDKGAAKKGRKMGHLTLTGERETVDQRLKQVQAILARTSPPTPCAEPAR
jgi:5-(carboxyamino)imidazole ribonucleotide synthase